MANLTNAAECSVPIRYLNAICCSTDLLSTHAQYLILLLFTLKMRINSRVIFSGRNSANRSNYRTHTAPKKPIAVYCALK